MAVPGPESNSCNWTKVNFGGHDVFMKSDTLQVYDPKVLTMECKETGIRWCHEVKNNEEPTHVKTFQDMPDEIVSTIFMSLRTKTLLRRCRLVSKRWKQVASEICRKRFVRMLDWWDDEELDNIFTLFDPENLPWSSCVFNPENRTCAFRMKIFLQFYGKHIWSMSLNKKVEADHYTTILGHTPNIRQLEVEFGERVWTPSEVVPNLRKLKRLELVRLDDSNVPFLKFIIEGCGARLDQFTITSDIELKNPVSAGTVAHLLRNVPDTWISLQTMYSPSMADDFKLLVSNMQDLCITKLSLWLSSERSDIIDYGPAEHLVAHHSEHLRELDVTLEGLEPIPFKFPLLPALTYFLVHFVSIYSNARTNSPGFLSLLQDNQFPVLDEFRFLGSEAYGTAAYYFPENHSFESVSKLTLSHNVFFQDQWNRLFPNLKVLDYIIHSEDYDALLEIFAYQTLEELTLEIYPKDGADMNVWLSGIPNPDAIYDKSEEEISWEREIQGSPSILQLTNLKMLDLTFACFDDNEEENLRDAGAYLSICQLQPLVLTLRNAQLSEKCVGKLRAHHLLIEYSSLTTPHHQLQGCPAALNN